MAGTPMRLQFCGLCAMLIAGCSGGSGNFAPPDILPIGQQSPGGVWQAVSGPGSALTFFIAETGEMKVSAQGPAFGSGAVFVTNGNRLTGAYQLRAIQPDPSRPADGERSCEVEGTVTERVSLQVTLRCTDAAGSTSSETFRMAYDPSHGIDSSLPAIAGNYTLRINPQTNALNINADGVIFGMFHNGPQCIVNGRVEVIDPNFNLYRFELEFSNCQAPFPRYEGVTMTGLGAPNRPGTRAGSFLLLISGSVDGRFEFFSVLYERT